MPKDTPKPIDGRTKAAKNMNNKSEATHDNGRADISNRACHACGQAVQTSKNDLFKKAQELSQYATIPAVAKQSQLIEQILYNDYLEQADVKDYEDIRTKLRDLIKFIPPDERTRYHTNFVDDVLSVEWNESQLDNDDLASELVRSIVGLSLNAANDAFSEFLNDAGLDSRQMHFVKQIVKYIVQNGMMKDLAVLQESPFSDLGSVSEVFDNMAMFAKLRTVIDGINRNAAA